MDGAHQEQEVVQGSQIICKWGLLAARVFLVVGIRLVTVFQREGDSLQRSAALSIKALASEGVTKFWWGSNLGSG